MNKFEFHRCYDLPYIWITHLILTHIPHLPIDSRINIFSGQYCSNFNEIPIEKCHLPDNVKKWLIAIHAWIVSIMKLTTFCKHLLFITRVICSISMYVRIAPQNLTCFEQSTIFFFQRLSKPCTCSLNNNTGTLLGL